MRYALLILGLVLPLGACDDDPAGQPPRFIGTYVRTSGDACPDEMTLDQVGYALTGTGVTEAGASSGAEVTYAITGSFTPPVILLDIAAEGSGDRDYTLVATDSQNGRRLDGDCTYTTGGTGTTVAVTYQRQ